MEFISARYRLDPKPFSGKQFFCDRSNGSVEKNRKYPLADALICQQSN